MPELSNAERDYCFDLDGREHCDEDNGENDRFTVNSYAVGAYRVL